MSDLPELLPCPFCGGECVRPFGSSLVGCKTKGCGLNLHLIEERLWNRRADLAPTVGPLVEALNTIAKRTYMTSKQAKDIARTALAEYRKGGRG